MLLSDTIDLQNQDAPTTQDHHSSSLQPSDVGKHQAAEIRHVLQERHSEEEHLHSAWTRTHDELQVDQLTDDQLQAHNHEHADSADDSEMDDDMLDDRISSSPSIDDGAYPAAAFAFASAWPLRSSSLTPPRQTLNCEASHTPDSSPFFSIPAHTPLYNLSTANSPASSSLQSSSPFVLSPKHLPLSASPLSIRHHHMGEYHAQRFGQYKDDDTEYHVQSFDHYHNHILPSTPEEHGEYHYDHYNDDSLPAAFEGDGEYTHDLFVPSSDSDSRATSPSSWSTVSDASATQTSQSPDLDKHDDDDDDDLDVSFYSDHRFVDSGWGGECLRETEDIDFDFVYALHTFVATVEGQANAGKGDTMVLLDDSNSYWWLVRIVKDNSIGIIAVPCGPVLLLTHVQATSQPNTSRHRQNAWRV
jgi:hypothetical protein